MLKAENRSSETVITIPIENEVRISNHSVIADHLEEAARHHHEAAKFHEEGNYDKAHKSSIFALGHCCIARELLKEDSNAGRTAFKNN